MPAATSSFGALHADETLAGAVRSLQVALQAELLRAGAQWDESLAILREMVTHRRSFGSATEAVAWYRQPYHPGS